jgi:hypothetical protein
MEMRTGARKPLRIALGVAGGVVVLLVVAQLVLPGIAARIARDQIGKYGSVRSVSLRAFPAIELLWGRADSAEVHATELRLSVSQLNSLIPRLRGVERVDMSADSLQVDQFKLQRAAIEKRGAEIDMRGTIDQADVQSALPAGTQAQLVENAQGTVEVRVRGSLFGFGASLAVTLSAQDGKLVAQPKGIPLAGLARLTLFSDQHLHVESVGLSREQGAAEGDYVVTLRIRLL